MERYITRGIANYLPAMLQQQLWKLVAQRESEQFKELEEIDYFHIFQFNMHNGQLYIKHKQERPEYVKFIRQIIQKLSILIRSTLSEKMM